MEGISNNLDALQLLIAINKGYCKVGLEGPYILVCFFILQHLLVSNVLALGSKSCIVRRCSNFMYDKLHKELGYKMVLPPYCKGSRLGYRHGLKK